MPLTLVKTANFGSGKLTLQPTLSGQLKDAANVNVGAPVSGAAITHQGSGIYSASFTLPDSYTIGGILWTPGDGSGNIYEEVNKAEEVGVNVVTTLAGLGAHAITVSVLTTAAVPIPGQIVVIRDSADATTVAWGVTDASGQIVFNLNAATYKVRINSTAGYVPLATQTLVVSAPASVTYNLAAQSYTEPLSPSMCVVRFWVYHNGIPLKNSKVEAKIIDKNTAINSAVLALQIDNKVTDERGYAELQLVRGASVVKGTGKYRITVSDPLGVVMSTFDAIIPNVATVDYEDLIV